MRCEGRGEWVVVSFLSRFRDSPSFVPSINRLVRQSVNRSSIHPRHIGGAFLKPLLELAKILPDYVG